MNFSWRERVTNTRNGFARRKVKLLRGINKISSRTNNVLLNTDRKFLGPLSIWWQRDNLKLIKLKLINVEKLRFVRRWKIEWNAQHFLLHCALFQEKFAAKTLFHFRNKFESCASEVKLQFRLYILYEVSLLQHCEAQSVSIKTSFI